MTTVFLLQGITSFANPGNWDPVHNKVECLGAGGTGSSSFNQGQTIYSGNGGGGGGYGYDTGLNPANWPVLLQVMPHGIGSNDYATYWVDHNTIRGGCGSQGTVTVVGGDFYPKGFTGGSGAANSTAGNGCGGGGAAGPHGAGGNGSVNGQGGAGDGGQTAGGGVTQSGAAGTQWDASHGVGGGGGGGAYNVVNSAGLGGAYGAGGGGAGISGGNGMPAADGLMVITWTPMAIGTLNRTQANQTLTAAGIGANAMAALNVAQAPQFLVGTIGNVTTGQVNITQADQGFMGWANVVDPPANLTIYPLNGPTTDPNFFGQTSLVNYVNTTPTWGWNPNTIPLTTPYYRGYIGAANFAPATGVAQASSWNASTSGPTPGTGTGPTSTGDSYIAGPFRGSFAAGAWTFNYWCATNSNNAPKGTFNTRIWKSANANGAGATQLAANAQSANVSALRTATACVMTWAAPAITLNNEYIFFQIEWQATNVGQSNTNLYLGFNSTHPSIGTTVFTPSLPPVGCTLNQTQSQTLTATGFVPLVNGTLNAVQQPHNFSGFGLTTAIYGALTEVHDNQTILARAGPVSGLALSLTQADQTLSGFVFGSATGLLNVTQADHTMVGKASGGVVLDNHTLVANGARCLSGALLGSFRPIMPSPASHPLWSRPRSPFSKAPKRWPERPDRSSLAD